ncbi:MAG: class I SAM-dependent methyltransferase [Candidatus Omnitrophica bacterium]|nr:class I SAM-dependent methyltransferase [Candidatus Omnitrophota bacterium]
MHCDIDLMSNHLFIIKKLQRDVFRRYAFRLTGRILDIGCGVRPYKRFLPQGVRYIGIDAASCGSEDVCARTETLPFADGCFDALICTEVLEHVKTPAESLREAGRVLKPGGYIYVSVPQSWGLHYEPDDYWRFTRYGIATLLESQGFSISAIERVGGVFSLIGTRFIDVAWMTATRCFSFLGKRPSERTATLLCLPGVCFFYLAAVLLDRIDGHDALGWGVLAQKK